MDSAGDRLDGWKAIARYLGRDRSTVIRWAGQRGLPIHALPGGKSRTVYAVKRELDVWMRGGGGEPERPETTDAPVIAPPPAPARAVSPPSAEPSVPAGTRRWPILLALAGCVAAAPAIYTIGIDRSARSERHDALDQAAQARLLQARDDIASRSEARLGHAIVSLRDMSARAPANADVHEALAEGYLLAREFGSLPDAMALERARAEAKSALDRRGDSATALRVLGVVAYWRDHDPAAGGMFFRRAIAAAPQDPLAHHWYANVLADNGEDAAAAREFAAARQLSPGTPYLLADYAWGLWSAGREREAETVLVDLVDRYPSLASIHDCLSVTAFARGDLAGYARHLRARASARGAPEIIGYARLVDDTVTRDRHELYDVMLTRALAQSEATPESDHSWPAFVASTFGDRPQLLAIMKRARERDEHWGASGYMRRIARRWASDRDVAAALRGLAQARIEA